MTSASKTIPVAEFDGPARNSPGAAPADGPPIPTSDGAALTQEQVRLWLIERHYAALKWCRRMPNLRPGDDGKLRSNVPDRIAWEHLYRRARHHARACIEAAVALEPPDDATLRRLGLK